MSLPDSSTPTAAAPSLPGWFSQGHIRDDLAQQLQAQMPPEAANVKFLSALRKPILGMRTETTIQARDGTTFRMTGMITSVGEEPTVTELSQSDSLLWRVVSTTNPLSSCGVEEQTPQDMKEYISSFVGSVHGQRIATLATVQDDDNDEDDALLLPWQGPIPSDAIAEITYKFNDNMYYPWIVEHFRVLEPHEIEAYSPAFFYEFYGQKRGMTTTTTNTLTLTPDHHRHQEHPSSHFENTFNNVNEMDGIFTV